jgi:hypothetical protein
MPANFSVVVSPGTVTVTLTASAGSSYSLNDAAIQLMNNASGATVASSADTIAGGTRTVNYSNVSTGGYTVLIACGGDSGRATVNVGSASLAIP